MLNKIARRQEEGKGVVDLNWSMTSNERHSYFQRNQGGERSEVESHATSSGQLALLARLTHAILFFLAATQRMLPLPRNLAANRSR